MAGPGGADGLHVPDAQALQPAADLPLLPVLEDEAPLSSTSRLVFDEADFAETFGPPIGFDETVSLSWVLPKCGCPSSSSSAVREMLLRRLPVLTWLPAYTSNLLMSDIVTGLTVGIFLIPQGLAFGQLAGLPSEYGLYMSIIPPVLYFFFGMSRELSTGTFAILSLLTNSALERYVDDIDNLQPGEQELLIDRAIALALLVGLLQLLMFVFRFSFITAYLSPPLTSGFTTGAAFVIAMSQLELVLGLTIPDQGDYAAVFRKAYYLLAHLPDCNAASFLIGLIAIIVLFVARLYSEGGRLCLPSRRHFVPVVWPTPQSRQLKYPIPGELFVVVLGTLVSYLADLEDKYGIEVVGSIPKGLMPVGIPKSDAVSDVLSTGISDVIVIAIVGYAVSVSIAKTFSNQKGYHVDDNQELFAIGAVNVVASFFSCYPSAPSLGRSALAASVGAQSQIYSLIAAAIILLTVLVLAGLFETLPNAILGAIILMALRGLFRQLRDFRRYLKIKIMDWIIWTSTFIAVLILGVALGLGVGIVVSIFTILYRTTHPYTCILGQVPGTELYRDISRVEDALELPGIKIFRYNASLFFANLEGFMNALYRLTGVDPRDPGASSIHTIIIDFSSNNDLDSAGVNLLIKISRALRTRKKVRLLLANCRGPVRDIFTRCKFYEHVGMRNLFVSVHDAVLFALTTHSLPLYLDDDPGSADAARIDVELLTKNRDPDRPLPRQWTPTALEGQIISLESGSNAPHGADASTLPRKISAV